MAIGATIVAVAVWHWRPPSLVAEQIRIEMTPDAFRAVDTAGAERWRHEFDPAYMTALPDDVGHASRVLTGSDSAVFAATSHRVRRSDGVTEGGELLWLSVDGRVQRSFSFHDRLTFDGVQYGAPWVITGFAVDESTGTRRTAVAAHHFQWAASMVTLLDEKFQRHGTYVQSGWIEAVHWLAPNRLLIAGFNHPRDGGMVALLDPSALDGQAPEAPGTHDYCETCGTTPPIRMVVMPRTEVNRATLSPFNRVRIQLLPDRIVARTIEVPTTGLEAVDVLYEFSPTLDLIRAAFSTRYWEVHQALQGQGKLAHARDACPDKSGPREVMVWDRDSRWTRVPIASSSDRR